VIIFLSIGNCAVREAFVLGTVNEVNASRAVSLTAPNAVREAFVLGTVNGVNVSRAVSYLMRRSRFLCAQ